jgi:tetratricopeptide (TPR) repeat protein
MSRLAQLLRDLRQRRVYRVGAIYAAVAWAIWQGAEIAVPALRLPDWWLTAVVVLTLVGLPVALVLAWLYDITPEGVTRAARPTPGEAPTRYRWPLAATLSAAFLLIIGGGFWWLRPGILGAVRPDAQVIAVLPFNTSGADDALLGEGMVDLLSVNLDGVGGIRTVDSRTVLHRWRQRAGDTGVDLEGALALGRDLGAGSVLLGSIVSYGAEVRLTAELHSVRGTELARAQADGHPDSVLALVDSLSIEMLREIWLAREPIPELRVEAITSGSVEAIRDYLVGLQHYRRSEWELAVTALERAVAEDSTFALALYHLAWSQGWATGQGDPVFAGYAEAAWRYSDRLPARERSLVAAFKLWAEGRTSAVDSALEHVRRYPDDPEGWYMLGEARSHSHLVRAFELDELYGPFDRALELDPSFSPALMHPLHLGLFYDDSVRYYHYLGLLEEAAGRTEVEMYRLLGLFFQPDSLRLALGSLTADPVQAIEVCLLLSFSALQATSMPPEIAVDCWERSAAALPEGDPRRLHEVAFQARLLASLGRLAEARAVYDSLWEVEPNVGMFELWPVIAGYADSSYAGRSFETLASVPPIPMFQQFAALNSMAYSLSRGDAAAARRWADEAAAAGAAAVEDSDSIPRFSALLMAGRGYADLLEGDTVAGLAKLEAGVEEIGYTEEFFWVWPFRFALAAVWTERPETQARGVRWLRHAPAIWDWEYAAPSFRLLGQVLEESGDRAGAADAYTRFIRLWEGADSELQPEVEWARRALERVAAEETG